MQIGEEDPLAEWNALSKQEQVEYDKWWDEFTSEWSIEKLGEAAEESDLLFILKGDIKDLSRSTALCIAKQQLRIIDYGEDDVPCGWTQGWFEWSVAEKDKERHIRGFKNISDADCPYIDEFEGEIGNFFLFPDDSAWWICTQAAYICSHHSLCPAQKFVQWSIKEQDAIKNWNVGGKRTIEDQWENGEKLVVADDNGEIIFRRPDDNTIISQLIDSGDEDIKRLIESCKTPERWSEDF